MESKKPTLGLVLSGGGARGAYQAGVLAAIAEVAQREGHSDPFRIYSGVSAGSINAASLACHAATMVPSTKYLTDLWSKLTTDDVFYADLMNLSKVGMAWATDFSFRKKKEENPTRSLFSTTPLHGLLTTVCNYKNIDVKIKDGRLRGVSVSALDYENLSTRTFFQGAEDIKSWNRPMHHSERCEIAPEHIMASAAIPLLFPAIKVNSHYYGDGCIRNQSPCSPAIYMGADRFIAIGVRRRQDSYFQSMDAQAPSIARIINVIFHSMMMDGIEQDLQRISQTNMHISMLNEHKKKVAGIREVNYLWFAPTLDFAKIASQKERKLPTLVKYILKGAGSLSEFSELVSFLLFEPSYCQQLIEIGYADGMGQQENLKKFFDLDKEFKVEKS